MWLLLSFTGNQGDRGFKLFDEDGIVSGGLNGIAYGDDVRLNVDFLRHK